MSWSRTPSSSLRAADMVPRASGAPSSEDSASRAWLGRGAQGVGVAEPGLLGRQRGVLTRLRRDRLDLLEAEAEQVGLPGPLRAPAA